MMGDDWVCHRPNRSHSVLEFDLMRDGLANPILPPSLAPPRAIRRDEEGRIWQLGAPTLEAVYDALARDRASILKCSDARRRSFDAVRRSHEYLYRSLDDPGIANPEQVARSVSQGTRALYASLLYGLLDDIAFATIKRNFPRSCPGPEVEEHLVSLMRSTTAGAALRLGIALPASLEFGAITSKVEATELLRPLNVEVPTFQETEARVERTISTWPACEGKATLVRNSSSATLFALLYEFGQENFFVGARFRQLVGHILFQRTAKADYLSMRFNEVVEALR